MLWIQEWWCYAQEKSGGGANELRLKDRVGITGSGLLGSSCPVVVKVVLFVEAEFVASGESKNEEMTLSTFEKGLLPGDFAVEFVPDELALFMGGAEALAFAID